MSQDPNELLGRRHPTIRHLRSLRRDGKLRRAEAVFLAEGRHLAREALDCNACVELAVVSAGLERDEEGRLLLRQIAERGLNCCHTSDAILDSLQDARSPQPILLLVRRPEWPHQAGLDQVSPPPLVVVAHGLQDPGNLGNVVRTAEAAGATACFVCGDGADPFHPRAVRASMGSIFRLPVSPADTDSLLELLRGYGISVYAADPAGSTNYAARDLTGPTALLFGSEGRGLASRLLAAADDRLNIPMKPGVDSLSVGSSAAVLLFEAARQRTRGRTRQA